MADASYGAKQAPTPDVQFATDLKAGKHTPYHKDEDRAALLAGIAAATANLGLQSTLASIDATLKAQADIAVSLWTDNSGAFYVRRDVIDQDSGTVAVTFTNPTGTAATPGAGLRPVANEESLHTETIRYVSNVSGTGHTAGDMLERVVVMDANASPPTVVSSTWVNLTTGAVMATPPTIGNLTANPTALPANAMTETTGAAILAKMITSPATAANQALEVAALGAPSDTAGQSTIMGQLKALNVYAADVTTPLPVKGQAPLVRIAPTLQTSAYTAGTVLFATTAIANLAPSNDQGIVLESLFVVDKDDEGAAITLHFFSSNVALGTLGSAPSLSDADAASSWLGSVDIVTGDYKDLGGVKVASLKGIGLNLQPGSGARTVWVGGIAVGTPTFAGTTDLTLGFGALG